MGLIRAGAESIKGVFADQWKEYFYCDALNSDILMVKAEKKANRRSSNKKGSDSVITSGSVIAVNEGQCMIIVDQGKVAEICDEPGEFVYDASTEPSLFCGNLSESVLKTFQTIGRRFTFGGDAGRDQRVYFVNTKEIIGNKFGTVNPIPYRVVDRNIGLDLEISIRCHGQYSFQIIDPILFYTNVCGNVQGAYYRENLESQMRSELLTAMQTAFAKIAGEGIRYYELAGHTTEIANALNAELSELWSGTRGIEIVSFGISGVKAPEEDEEMIKQLQRTAVFRDPGMAAASLTGAQADAMRAAASNTATGPMMAFANMNMAAQAGGMNAQDLFAMSQANRQQNNPQQSNQQPYMQQMNSQQMNSQQEQQRMSKPSGGWKCSCGAEGNTGKFCSECGSPKPTDGEWICSCGAVNKGKFCSECGAPKPAAGYRCNKCGWEPEEGAKLPRFCPECGDPFNEEDRK